MVNVGLAPPRLPEPPVEIDRQYLQDLVRAIEFFITQQQTTEDSDKAQSMSWFFD